ncbi:hypothetical protein [Arcanobacterium canis]
MSLLKAPTADQLDALPAGTILRNTDTGEIWQKRDTYTWAPLVRELFTSAEVTGAATSIHPHPTAFYILYQPEEENQ